MGLGLVLVLMRKAAEPGMWTWLWSGQPSQHAPAKSADSSPPPEPRRAPPPALEKADVFRSPSGTVTPTMQPKNVFPGVDPHELEAVRDDTVFFNSAEKKAWFHLVEVLEHSGADRLKAASTGKVSWRQLFDQPSAYRGELVTVTGLLRRVNEEKPRREEAAIQRYYKTWLQPDDNPTSPMIVYCLELPEGFPIGLKIKEAVTITGVFFKRTAYQAQGKIWLAPLLVAKTLTWKRAVAQQETSAEPAPLWLIALIAAAFGLIVARLLWSRTPAVNSARSDPIAANRFRGASHDSPDTRDEIEAALRRLENEGKGEHPDET